jgi:anti-anti-sigma regulatory factor
MSLTVEATKNGNDVVLTLAGVMDENSVLPEFPSGVRGRVVIDLADVSMINSLGCRNWIAWIKGGATVPGGVALVNCSPAVVNQTNILIGFLPGYVRVESFFVPYYCEGCGREERILLTHGHEFDADGRLALVDEMPCPDCKAIMALDVIRERYFKFLFGKTA